MKTNQDYKNAALAALKGNWAPAVLATVIVLIAVIIYILPNEIASFMGNNPTSMADPAILLGKMLPLMGFSTIAYYFLMLPLELGYANAHLRLLTSGENNLTDNMFHIAFNGYGRKVWGMFLVGLFTALWMLLFIIPGIVKTFAYAMTPFILEEHPELSANQAIDRSVAMMKGHKFDLFYLELSFIGWFLLAFLTLGIGLLWVIPYMETSIAAFYEDVKADYEAISMD